MEFVPCGTLEQMIKKSVMTSQKAWKYFRGLIMGVEYCHEKANVVHRDIKPENLLIDINDNVKIADFGVSFMMDYTLSDEMTVMAGSHYFMAPEVCTQERYKGRPSDIWAMGVTLYYMLSRKLPFEGKNIQDLYKNIATKEPDLVSLFSANQSNLLKKMMCKDPEKRASIKDVRVDDWVTKHGQFPIAECGDSAIVLTYSDRVTALTRLRILTHIKDCLHRKLVAMRKRKDSINK